MANEQLLSLESLCPRPRTLENLNGLSELSDDIRLVTSNVLPVQRKAMRGIFGDSGIRVVANKKKFVVDVSVCPAKSGDGDESGQLDLASIPEIGHETYHEVTFKDNVVSILTATQEGALWGSLTVATVYRSLAGGRTLNSLKVSDWATTKTRGVVLSPASSLLGSLQVGWSSFLNTLLSARLNVLGVPVFMPDASGRQISLGGFPECDELKEYAGGYGEQVPYGCKPEDFQALLVVTLEKGIPFAPVFGVVDAGCPLAAWHPELISEGRLTVERAGSRAILSRYYQAFFMRFFPTGGSPVVLDLTGVGEDSLVWVEELGKLLDSLSVSRLICVNVPAGFAPRLASILPARAEILASEEQIAGRRVWRRSDQLALTPVSVSEYPVIPKLTEYGLALWNA